MEEINVCALDIKADVDELTDVDWPLEPMPLNPQVPIDTDLNKDQMVRFLKLMEEYRSSFATSVSELGCCTLGWEKIELTDNDPVVSQPYRTSVKVEKALRNEGVLGLLKYYEFLICL